MAKFIFSNICVLDTVSKAHNLNTGAMEEMAESSDIEEFVSALTTQMPWSSNASCLRPAQSRRFIIRLAPCIHHRSESPSTITTPLPSNASQKL